MTDVASEFFCTSLDYSVSSMNIVDATSSSPIGLGRYKYLSELFSVFFVC